jgi:hypothetical protein
MTKIAKHSEKSSATRTRNWTILVYPDSAPENWRDIINSWHIAWAHSPLHDKDLNPDSEEDKKAHWHVALLFDSVKSFEQVRELTKVLNCPIPKQINSLVGTIRYFIHMDDPSKYQYSRDEIKAYGSIDIDELLKPSKSVEISFVKQITNLLVENNIYEFCDASDFIQEAHPDLFETFMGHTFYFSSYLKSRLYKSIRLGNDKPEKTK